MGNFSCSGFVCGGIGNRSVSNADGMLFTIEELNAYMDAFTHRKFLGRGIFGPVYLGVINGRMESNFNGKQVAVKLSRNKDEIRTTHWQAEKEYLPQLIHQNIIELIGYCETPERFYLVYPFMKNGSVLSKLAGLDWSKTLKIMRGVASGIEKLHGQDPPLIHGDLKLNNVLLDKNFTPKIADFGMVTPEEEKVKSSTKADDIKSFGFMILQLIMKEKNAKIPGVTLPWDISWLARGRYYSQEEHAVHNTLIRTGCTKRAATALSKLALDCVKDEAFERPTIAQIIHTLANLEGKIA